MASDTAIDEMIPNTAKIALIHGGHDGKAAVYPELLSLHFCPAHDADGVWIRVAVSDEVKYINTTKAILKKKFSAKFSLILGFDLVNDLPYGNKNWNVAYIARDSDSGELKSVLSIRQLPEIRKSLIWHRTSVDVMHIQSPRPVPDHCYYATVTDPRINAGKPTNIWAKYMRAPIDCDKGLIEDGLPVYQLLHDVSSNFTVAFLGNITENGRVTGYMVERPECCSISRKDKSECLNVLRKFHSLGLVHRKIHACAFVRCDDGHIKLTSLFGSRPGTAEEQQEDLEDFECIEIFSGH